MQDREKAVKAHTFDIFTLEAEAAFLFAGPAAFCNILMFACTRNSFVLRTGQATFTADTLCQEIKTWVWIPIFCILLLLQRPENFLDSIL